MTLFVAAVRPEWANARRCEQRLQAVAWNHWHPFDRVPVPAIVEPEVVSRNADEFDALLALMIAESMLDG